MDGYLDVDLNDHEFRMNGCVSTATIVLRRRSPLRRSVAAPACESLAPRRGRDLSESPAWSPVTHFRR